MKKEAEKKEEVGLVCRKCGCRHFYVVSTRKVNNRVIRYRRCRYCGKSMTTQERAVT